MKYDYIWAPMSYGAVGATGLYIMDTYVEVFLCEITQIEILKSSYKFRIRVIKCSIYRNYDDYCFI